MTARMDARYLTFNEVQPALCLRRGDRSVRRESVYDPRNGYAIGADDTLPSLPTCSPCGVAVENSMAIRLSVRD